MAKHALVAGGAGFLGSHLCDLLLSKGYAVHCVDNLLTGTRSNITHLTSNPAFTFVQHDVSTVPLPSFGSTRFSLVFNLASPASPIDYQKVPIETLTAGSFGTYHLLELARAHGARFVQASTSEVYGDPLVHPQPETYWGNVNPLGVRSCYDEAKRFGESLCMAYYRTHSLDVRIARVFNTYGPRMRLDDGRVVPNFIVQALSNKPLTIYGDGKQTRSFCYVSDLVHGFLLLSEKTGMAGQVVNLGNPSEFTMNEFAHAVLKATGSRSTLSFKPLPHDDPRQRKPDISKAKKLLGWAPKISLKEGLIPTVEDFRQRLQKK